MERENTYQGLLPTSGSLSSSLRFDNQQTNVGKESMSDKIKKGDLSHSPTPPTDIITYFRAIIADGYSPATQADLNKFVNSLEKHLNGRKANFSAIEVLFNSYKSWLLSQGKSARYVQKTLQYFRSLYNKAVVAGDASPTKAFDSLTSVRAKAPESAENSETPKSSLHTARIIANRDMKALKGLSATRDLFLLSLFTGGIPCSDILKLDKTAFCEGKLHHTVSNEASSRAIPITVGMKKLLQAHEDADKLFRLHVSDKSQEYNLPDMMKALFRYCGLDYTVATLSTSRLWTGCALECGISPSVISKAAYSVPEDSPASLFNDNHVVSDSEIADALATVEAAIKDYDNHWYAAHLRGHSTPEQVSALLMKELPPSKAETFYPTHEVVKRVDGSLKKETEPYIRDVVFLRTDIDTIGLAARLMGEAAWVYRTNNTPRSPYAIITDREMQSFQIVTRNFFPGMEFIPNECHTFQKGRKVRIIEGPLRGYEGEISDLGDEKRELLISFISNLGYRITAEVPDYWIKEV